MNTGIVICAVITAFLAVFCCNAFAASGQLPLQTAEKVDLQKYMGVWHEISRLEHGFQKHCIGSGAEYKLAADNEVEVLNSCTDERDGRRREAKGRAWSVDPVNNSKLKVSFFWPFRGDYWIIELGENYRYSVVGSPDRKYLWILGREPELDESLYQKIVERLRTQGFPVDSLVKKPLKGKSENAKLL
ncbi:MAG: lipocalin family protein [Geobacteraceae bacterium]|nr:lipocalin family protein [Geobacteraceae bacterium]